MSQAKPSMITAVVQELRNQGFDIADPEMDVVGKLFNGLVVSGGVSRDLLKVRESMTSLVQDVFESKYMQKHLLETSPKDVFHRVASAVAKYDPENKDNGSGKLSDTDWQMGAFQNLMEYGILMPAGRILAGAGTGKRVTLMNCYVNGRLDDSMEGIVDGLRWNMLTLQQGGGMGTCFSQLRPKGAILHRTFSEASGPLPFMDTWDASCKTIKSSGDRRGAMMATISCTHPDLLSFVTAKHEKGRLTNFNVSVLITDAFMEAVQEDADWDLYFSIPPITRDEELALRDFIDDEGVRQYVYSTHKAKDLWLQIIESTYVYSEPGVIFVDRINELNNLNYCEYIDCTNPCGEQPLPPHGACNLAAINVGMLVTNPFTEKAKFNWHLLARAAQIATIFLDNVIDITNYPLEEQRVEQETKRRIGLGMSGLADAMIFLGMRYGSPSSIVFAERVAKTIAVNSYLMSCYLATHRGSFPRFEADKYADNATNFVSTKLPKALRTLIRSEGIRNSLLGTVAPTGTTSIAFGNISSGLEPVFAHSMKRNVLQNDGTFASYTEYSFAARAAAAVMSSPGAIDLMPHAVVAEDLGIAEHLNIQAACQSWTDASISKTINCPEDMEFEDFMNVYLEAYRLGCKGCTTYKPSDVRGSILEKASAKVTSTESVVAEGMTAKATVVLEASSAAHVPAPILERPDLLHGRTVKLSWPHLSSSLYITLNELQGRPWEIFFNSKDQKYMEWMTAITILMSASLRQGLSLSDTSREFSQIVSVDGGAWVEGKYYPSLMSYIGTKIINLLIKNPDEDDGGFERHIPNPPEPSKDEAPKTTVGLDASQIRIRGQRCPSCGSYNTSVQSGCPTCHDCGWSKCS